MAETLTNKPSTAPTIQTSTKPKVVKVWKYKLGIFALALLLLVVLGSAGYIGYRGYRLLEDKKKENSDIRTELSQLRDERNVNVVDLKNQIDSQNRRIIDLETDNSKLVDQLNAANIKVADLTPKNIKDLNYKELIKINTASGDVWLNPIYVDVNGDGKLDGIFANRLGGTGGFLNVYVYSYLENNSLSEVLRAEEYQKGTVAYITEQNIVEIKSQSGTPDSPVVATTHFKWDSASKKLVKVP